MKYLKRFKEIFEDVKFPVYMSNPVGYYSAPVGYTMKGSELEEEVIDYSGEYENSRQFVLKNSLEDEFLKQHDYVQLEDYDDIEDMITDIGNDEEVIQNLLPKDYYMYYNSDEDSFIVTKKNKKEKIDFSIDYSGLLDSEGVENVFDTIGLHTTFEPRFAVKHKDEVIGGTTFFIEKDYDGLTYHFDIAILDEYQGMGISKPLINKIIDDANTLGCDYLEAEVVNYQLSLYLDKIGFDIEDLGYKRLATMTL